MAVENLMHPPKKCLCNSCSGIPAPQEAYQTYAPDQKQAVTNDQLLNLLKRATLQLEAWSSKYGEHNPDWLPPAGDVRLLEDIAEVMPKQHKPKAF